LGIRVDYDCHETAATNVMRITSFEKGVQTGRINIHRHDSGEVDY